MQKSIAGQGAIYYDSPFVFRQKNPGLPKLTQAERKRLSRRRKLYSLPSDWEDSLVSATEARRHIVKLIRRNHLSCSSIARASGLALNTIVGIRNKKYPKIFPATAEKILGVCSADRDNHTMPSALVDKKESLRLIDELIDAGFGKHWIARQIGAAKYGSLIGRGKMQFKTTMKIKELHDTLWHNNTEGFVLRPRPQKEPIKIYSGKTLRDTCKCHAIIFKEDRKQIRLRKEYDRAKRESVSIRQEGQPRS